eukprot:367043-Prymnesium_polylepis.1
MCVRAARPPPPPLSRALPCTGATPPEGRARARERVCRRRRAAAPRARVQGAGGGTCAWHESTAWLRVAAAALSTHLLERARERRGGRGPLAIGKEVARGFRRGERGAERAHARRVRRLL